ncbi:hypothetical protein KHS38_06290 [Mucilaginibacter sp. Bleaf8]|uniref:STM3941 family protein n=1 Tax=Mucilaginibacter sp. Bleaf8 TaxID=2834430 RepID=UPI001BCE9CBE|nr:STM3941 family protein [Mucilaginibacter sp. Bleaf8]MBS7564009.1 hypothetical protein [Mucilaginibacter sp. Bleaf8]
MTLYFETVSVKEAIKKGNIKITVPTVILFIICIAGAIVIGLYTWPVYIPFIWFAGFIGIALYRQYAINKWKLWAFENVRNVHELRQRAIFAGFFKEKDLQDNNLLGLFNIISKEDKEKWLHLQEKFNRPDIFIDDLSVPAETVVYYSKWKNLVLLIFYLPFLALAIGCFMAGRTDFYMYVAGVLMLALAFGLTYIAVKNATNRTPQIIINNRGLTTLQKGFYPWQDIKDEKTIWEKSGKRTRIYLTYEHPGSTAKFLLGTFTINRLKLEHMLRIYRGRFEAAQKH